MAAANACYALWIVECDEGFNVGVRLDGEDMVTMEQMCELHDPNDPPYEARQETVLSEVRLSPNQPVEFLVGDLSGCANDLLEVDNSTVQQWGLDVYLPLWAIELLARWAVDNLGKETAFSTDPPARWKGDI